MDLRGPPAGQPLLRLRGVRREYHTGGEAVVALRDVDLDIQAGEMISIVGASGSGKSTLMNILGCLDRPTAGSYAVAGRETGMLDPDALAELRREHFGFIFQRYHLLGDLSAVRNVEVPAIYAGRAPQARRERAEQLLIRLGLAHRLGNRPSQLSGGQQQRVSIARALMNGGAVILADEPTGALDSASGEQLLQLLKELNAEGHTVIIVTHDKQVASHSRRVIEVSDGRVVADRRTDGGTGAAAPPRMISPVAGSGLLRALLERFEEALHMALVAMNAHRMRTFLTMLGIIIGIASVVSIVGIGAGAQQQILDNIASMGTNTLDILPGKGFGDMHSAAIDTLTVRDADALATQSYVDSLTPTTSASATARAGNETAAAQVQGVGPDFFRVRGRSLVAGSLFDRQSVRDAAQVALLEPAGAEKFYGSTEAAVGRVLLLDTVPVRVVGVLAKPQNNMFNSNSVSVYVPYSTVSTRFTGSQRLQSMTVRVADTADTKAAEAAVREFLTRRHGATDFTIMNSDSFRETVTKVTGNLTLLVSAIAVISLVVGGIGVMNIMLVSVTERTREIGVRMAVGARQGDIMQQFLIEAVLVCLVGGMIGLGIALALSILVANIASDFRMVISAGAILAAFACCTLIGVGFGFLPARSAARLDPVEALARD